MRSQKLRPTMNRCLRLHKLLQSLKLLDFQGQIICPFFLSPIGYFFRVILMDRGKSYALLSYLCCCNAVDAVCIELHTKTLLQLYELRAFAASLSKLGTV